MRRLRRRGGWLRCVLRHETGKIRHVLLQRSDLGLQGSNLLRQDEERSGKLWRRDCFEGRLFAWKGSQAPLMEVGQHLQVFIAHPFFPAIGRMALQGKLCIGQPAVQRFGIDAQAMSSLD
jgi:hypothetical protein